MNITGSRRKPANKFIAGLLVAFGLAGMSVAVQTAALADTPTPSNLNCSQTNVAVTLSLADPTTYQVPTTLC